MIFFKSGFTKQLGSLNKEVKEINSLENKYINQSDDDLREVTSDIQDLLSHSGENIARRHAFAAVREVSQRVLGMRHFDVQLLGGLALDNGCIAEMGTGEGKTLAATLAAYFSYIKKQKVHIVTVNDYLAQRDAKWMAPIYDFLGVKVSYVKSDMPFSERKEAYEADIIYGQANDFGFDYLRDNMAQSLDGQIQSGHHHVIIDEVDSVCIDGARVPLAISGQGEEQVSLMQELYKISTQLERGSQAYVAKSMFEDEIEPDGDFVVEEKERQVHLTDAGHTKLERLLVAANLIAEGDNLYDVKNLGLVQKIQSCLLAANLYDKNVKYIVRDGQIVIIDENTGRLMPGRRWSDGIHQAVEAKEGVEINQESQTVATITFQNYFRLYNKLSGMTGTAATEAEEFSEIYNLGVVVIPSHRICIRKDLGDRFYMSADEKYNGIVEDIVQFNAQQRPVLVGTDSVEVSEVLAAKLERKGIKFVVLNAKLHDKEAMIVANAGRLGAVTITTNMAGRGTDIVLGGSLESRLADLGADGTDSDAIAQERAAWLEEHNKVKEIGGLHIIGSGRSESRRADNQLRGRAGRQGDPGSSQFYVSLDDDLIRIFASDNVVRLMKSLGVERGEVIEKPMITRSFENAQRKIENHNFDIRRQLLRFDDVANDQRKIIYQQRNAILQSDDLDSSVGYMLDTVVNELAERFIESPAFVEAWDIAGISANLVNQFRCDFDVKEWLLTHPEPRLELLLDSLQEAISEVIVKNFSLIEDKDQQNEVKRSLMLQVVDQMWKENLTNMDSLRHSVSLRSYAQKNPIQEYQRESFTMFKDMLKNSQLTIISSLCRLEIRAKDNPEDSTVRRNDPCPCGSGEKYKYCHGKLN